MGDGVDMLLNMWFLRGVVERGGSVTKVHVGLDLDLVKMDRDSWMFISDNVLGTEKSEVTI